MSGTLLLTEGKTDLHVLKWIARELFCDVNWSKANPLSLRPPWKAPKPMEVTTPKGT